MERVLICTPAGQGTYDSAYVNGLMRLMREGVEGYHFDWFMVDGSSMISKTRDKMFWHWYGSTTHEHMVWIDADQGYTPESLALLLACPGDIRAGLVPLKHVESKELCEWVIHHFVDPDEQAIDATELLPATAKYNAGGRIRAWRDGDPRYIEVDHIGTAFMAISRPAAQTMVEHHRKARALPMFRSDAGERDCPAFHAPRFDDQRYLGEDYAFCSAARDAGLQIVVDTHIKVDHVGRFVWRGDYLAAQRYRALRSRHAEADRG